MNTSIMTGEKIILLTNSNAYQMPSIIGWSRSDVIALMKLLKIPYQIDGYGYVTSQSIEKGTTITNDLSMSVTLSGTLES